MKSRIWTTAAIVFSAAFASALMLLLSPTHNRVAGFALWLLFFVMLLWPLQRMAARRSQHAHRA